MARYNAYSCRRFAALFIVLRKYREMNKEISEWVTVNILGSIWALSAYTEVIQGGLFILGSIALIWYNVEKALKVRAERKKLKK